MRGFAFQTSWTIGVLAHSYYLSTWVWWAMGHVVDGDRGTFEGKGERYCYGTKFG